MQDWYRSANYMNEYYLNNLSKMCFAGLGKIAELMQVCNTLVVQRKTFFHSKNTRNARSVWRNQLLFKPSIFVIS
jgi:hypothetical protein